jgi:hypothetical protein
MSNDGGFNMCKYTNWACGVVEADCAASSAADREDCECFNTRGQPCCASFYWVLTPFTMLIDIITCGPRYLHQECHSTKPQPIITIQPFYQTK